MKFKIFYNDFTASRDVIYLFTDPDEICTAYRRFNAIVSQLKMHYFSGGAFESLISSQLLK